jgi:hypothetical protein
MSKKKTIQSSAVALLLWLVACVPSLGQSENDTIFVDGIAYLKLSASDSTVEVAGRLNDSGNKSSVNIPPFILYQGKHYAVTSIGYGAFFYQEEIQSVTLPESIKTIGYAAFFGCSHLKEIKIPLQVETIGSFAFVDTNITSLFIPRSVLKIGDSSFSGCQQLQSIEIDSLCPNYKVIDGVLYTKDGKELISYPAGKRDKVFVIPEQVTQMGCMAMKGSIALECVYFPSGITTLANEFFKDCLHLKELHVKIKDPQPANEFRYMFLPPQSVILYCPKGTAEKFKKLYGWSCFKEIKEE